MSDFPLGRPPGQGSRADHHLVSPAVLEARGLSKSYAGRHVLEGVSLRLSRGEGLALLGPNGSGKTTLLSLLAGVLRADRGSALALGEPIAHKRARRALAFVPQHPAVYDGLSGIENVTLFGRLHGLAGPALRDGVQAALRAAELWKVRDQRASAYSGGMRRRLSLACALVHGPSLLLLDEPFEGIDDDSRAHLLDVLATSKRRGVALVLSTHRVEEVTALCERFLVLHEGRVVAERLALEHTLAPLSTAGEPGSRPRDLVDGLPQAVLHGALASDET
jgi:ABC-2 type transport system ATP-binding protein